MSYAKVVAKNAPPEERQAHPDTSLLTTAEDVAHAAPTVAPEDLTAEKAHGKLPRVAQVALVLPASAAKRARRVLLRVCSRGVINRFPRLLPLALARAYCTVRAKD